MSGGIRNQGGEGGSGGGTQCGFHPGLNDTVTAGYDIDAVDFFDLRFIQWMDHDTNQFAQLTDSQIGIAVQRDHILCIFQLRFRSAVIGKSG